jgi:hypothetical protein
MVVYVKLLNEGTEVYRPVVANKIQDNIYQLIEQNYDSEDEHWEFLPGSIVIVEERSLSGSNVLVAISRSIP